MGQKFMIKLLKISFILIFCSCAYAQIETKILPGYANKFELPSFDEKSGYKEWELFGDEGTYISDDKILVKKMKLELFDGSENLVKKFTILSDSAELFQKIKSAGGDNELFVTGDGLYIEGKTWLWDGINKKISLFNGVKIDFEEEKDKDKSTITSTRASFSHGGENHVFEFENSVKVRGIHSDIDSDKLILITEKDSGVKEAKEAIASGNVLLTQEDKIATAGEIRLIPSSEQVEMTQLPIITDTKNKSQLFGSKIFLDKQKNYAESFSDKSTKAKAIILYNQDDTPTTLTIIADKIEMQGSEDKNVFEFKGNVKLTSDDFDASCDYMSAETELKNSSHELAKLFGKGSVNIRRGTAHASAKEFEYIPETSEFWLTDNAKMSDIEKGVFVESHVIIMLQDSNKALAVSKKDNPNSFVKVRILQAKDKDMSGNKISQTDIKSRQLVSTKTDDKIALNFVNDVEVVSGDMRATCAKMNVYADSKGLKDKTQITLIEALDNVIITQKAYTAKAEIVKIYPQAEMSDEEKKTNHTFTELLTSEEKSDLRPTIILPPMGNIGLNETLAAGSKADTIIISDRQALIEGADKDRYFFDSNVVVTGSDMNATCEKIEVIMKDNLGKSTKEISQIIATEKVKITQGTKEAHAGRADIFPAEEMLVLSESPYVLNKDNNTKAVGHRMTYRKGKKGISIEGLSEDKAQTQTKYKRPTIILPPIN